MSRHTAYWRIDVTCSHAVGAPQRPRLLGQLTWEENDPEDVELLTGPNASIRDPRAAEVLLRNERFGTWSHRLNGRTRQEFAKAVVPFPIETGAAERAGALEGWRFRCKCGADVPVRQDKLEAWFLTQKSRHPERGVFTFDVAEYR